MRRRDGQVFHWQRAHVHSEVARFHRSLIRVEGLLKSGRFWKLAESTRESMRRMLTVLYRRLSEMQRRWVARAAVAMLALGLATAPLGAEQMTFQQVTGSGNPFGTYVPFAHTYDQPAPTFADLDGDGDADAIVGETYSSEGTEGFLWFYRQDDSPPAEFLAEDVYSTMFPLPADTMVNQDAAYPTLVDMDGDGDLDLFVGGKYSWSQSVPPYASGSGAMRYYRQNGGVFEIQLDAANPLPLPADGARDQVSSAFADLDGDGLKDAVVFTDPTYGSPSVAYFRNTGSASSPQFTEDASPFGEASFPASAAPAFADLDGDGDYDAIVGDSVYDNQSFGYYGRLRFFENTGSASSPVFTENEQANPFAAANVAHELNSQAIPAFVDVDQDGDLDLFVGGIEEAYTYEYYLYTGRIQFYRNTTPPIVTAASQSVTNAAGQAVVARSNKSAGHVYVVLDGTLHATVADLEAAVTQHRAAKTAVTAANVDVDVSAAGLEAGTYFAYAVSGGAAPQISAAGANGLSIAAATAPTVIYPESSALDSSDVWIHRVVIGDLVSETGNDAGYADLTQSGSGAMTRGGSVSVELVPGFKPGARYSIRRLAQQTWRVWVDWNQDGDFDDAAEEAAAPEPSQRALSATITVPLDALAGATRIRVSMRFAGDGAPLSVGDFDRGEVEDYTATVAE